MTMHLVRGMSSLNTKRRKTNRKPGWQATQLRHEEFLKSMGVTGKKSDYRIERPDLSTGPRMTSDQIPGNGTKKDQAKYTGDEIAGIALNHKQNYEPVRRDNKQAAIDSAQMRRN